MQQVGLFLVDYYQTWFLSQTDEKIQSIDCLFFSKYLPLRGASVSPNPRLPSFRKFWTPIFPNCFLLKLQSLRIQLLGRLQFLRFLLFFKWPFLTSKCQNFEKSYKINLKDEIIVDQYPKVNTFKLFYIGVRLWISQRLKNSESLEPWIIQSFFGMIANPP